MIKRLQGFSGRKKSRHLAVPAGDAAQNPFAPGQNS